MKGREFPFVSLRLCSRAILCILVSCSPCNFRDLSRREEERHVHRGGPPAIRSLQYSLRVLRRLFRRQKRSHRKCYRISSWRPIDFNDFSSRRGETVEFTRLPARALLAITVVTLLWRIRANSAGDSGGYPYFTPNPDTETRAVSLFPLYIQPRFTSRFTTCAVCKILHRETCVLSALSCTRTYLHMYVSAGALLVGALDLGFR